MKKELIFLTGFAFCISWPLLQAQSPGGGGGETAQHEKSVPIEQLKIGYFQTKEGNIIPANVNEDMSVAYLWKGVLLKTSQVPGYLQAGSFGIAPFNMPELQKKLILKETQPPLKYLLTKEQTYKLGYFDQIRKIFYNWDLEYDRDQLPKNAEQNGLIVKDTLLQMSFSTIAPPSEKGHNLERLQKDYDDSLEKRRIASVSEAEIAAKKFGPQAAPVSDSLPKDKRVKEQSSPGPLAQASNPIESSFLGWLIVVLMVLAVVLVGAVAWKFLRE